MNTESFRIYVPANRMHARGVRESVDRVIHRRATLYRATGTWHNGRELVSENVVVVEVLGCDAERQRAIDLLVAALLAAGEEAVLVATQEVVTRISMPNYEVSTVRQP